MSHNISGATFIRNTISGAFCLFESMASLLPLVDDLTVIDLGSTDGTLQILQEIAAENPAIRVVQGSFSCVDARAFADVANQCVAAWDHDTGFFWQADEIWHEELLRLTAKRLVVGASDLTFWRYQLRENFQVMKWPPHLVHRLGTKGKFRFVDDGMNTDRAFEPLVCSTHDARWFTRWGSEFMGDYTRLPTHEMVLDVSGEGGFLENIKTKRTLHAPMWHESPNVGGTPVDTYYARESRNPNWTRTDIPYDIPHIMRYHVGRTRYEVRPELVEALKAGDTERMLGL